MRFDGSSKRIVSTVILRLSVDPGNGSTSIVFGSRIRLIQSAVVSAAGAVADHASAAHAMSASRRLHPFMLSPRACDLMRQPFSQAFTATQLGYDGLIT